MASRNSHMTRASFLLCFMLVYAAFSLGSNLMAQRGLIDDRFCKIIPGESTRADVERIFPKAKSGEFSRNENFVDFNDKELSIFVKYSTGRCGDSLPDFGTFPKWTVTQVSYSWPDDDQISLTDVIIDLRMFEKKRSGDVINFDRYINVNSGISVEYDKKSRSVDGIFLEPAASFIRKYGKCS